MTTPLPKNMTTPLPKNQTQGFSGQIKDEKTLEDKLKKHASIGYFRHHFNEAIHSIGRAFEELKSVFMPKLEKLKLKEDRIIKEINKKPRLEKEKTKLQDQLQVINEKLNQGPGFRITATGKYSNIENDPVQEKVNEKTKIENQLLYINAKLEKVDHLKTELNKTRLEIDKTNLSIMSIEEKFYLIEKKLDKFMNELNDAHKTQELKETNEKDVPRSRIELINEKKDLIGKFSRVIKSLDKELSSEMEPRLKAKLYLFRENLIRAKDIIDLFSKAEDLKLPNDSEIRKEALKKEIRLKYEELVPIPEKITAKQQKIKQLAIEVTKKFNINNAEYSEAYSNWQKQPFSVEFIEKFSVKAEEFYENSNQYDQDFDDLIKLTKQLYELQIQADKTQEMVKQSKSLESFQKELDGLSKEAEEIKTEKGTLESKLKKIENTRKKLEELVLKPTNTELTAKHSHLTEKADKIYESLRLQDTENRILLYQSKVQELENEFKKQAMAITTILKEYSDNLFTNFDDKIPLVEAFTTPWYKWIENIFDLTSLDKLTTALQNIKLRAAFKLNSKEQVIKKIANQSKKNKILPKLERLIVDLRTLEEHKNLQIFYEEKKEILNKLPKADSPKKRKQLEKELNKSNIDIDNTLKKLNLNKDI